MDRARKLTLLDRRCECRKFVIPAGYIHKSEGVAQIGDRWWRWGDESWQPIGEHAFKGSAVRLLQCVITREPTAVEDHDGQAARGLR